MQIYITRNGQQYGPYDEAAIRAGLGNGSFTPADLAWYEGAAGWGPLSAVPGLGIETPPPPPPQPAGPPPITAGPQMIPLAPGAVGRKPTPKWVAYLSAAVTIVSIVVGLLIFFGRKEMMGTAYKASPTETVNYSGKATEADARKLADGLKAEGYFGNGKSMDVLLKKEENGRTIVSFVTTSGWNDENLVKEFRDFGTILIKRGAVSPPLTVRMIDTKLNLKQELPIK